jgi:protein-disulfide isomerase
MIKQLQEEFRMNLKFVFRNFPLQEVHPNAEMAAETAEFAADNNRFWELHDSLYENQERLSPDLMVELTKMLGLSIVDLQNALVQKIYEPKIQADFMGGVRSGVNGTPAFFINGERYDGLPDYPNLVYALQRALLNKNDNP